jgi:molecular chaperone DnaK
MILQKLKQDAEAYLGEPVTKAVITVPSYSNDCQRQATKDAGRSAGLEVLRIINESTAACLAYGLHRERDMTVAVCHLGGGTFDISILETGNGVLQVKATSGDTHLGGDDWDQRIVDYVVDEFRTNQGIDLRKDPQALQWLKEACERAKIELSTVMDTVINLPFITADASGPMNLQMKLTRVKLEKLTKDLIERTIEPCKQALNDAGLKPFEIHEVVLVGQQTRAPAVQEAIKEFFGRTPCRGVNPAEAVALGAAVQAGVLAGEVKDLLLLDVTPFTLSVETLGGVVTPLIERNTTIPTKKSEIFSTASDGQTSVDIRVYQGERPVAADNVLLGQLRLDGIPPAPRKVPQVEVAFEIDGNSILSISALDKATGRKQSVTFTAHGGRLAPAGFGTSRKGALPQSPAATTKAPATPRAPRPQDTWTRRDAKNLIYRVVNLSSERGDDLLPHIRDVVDSKVSALRTVLQRGSIAEIRDKTKELAKVLQCVEALGEPDQGRAMELFGKLFAREKDKQDRERIWQALTEIGGTAVTVSDALGWNRRVGGLATDTTKKSKARSIEQLVVKPLAAVLKNGNPHLQRRAAKALGWIGGESAVQPLTGALHDRDDAVRREAMQALARFAVESLVAALEDAGVDMQQKVPGQLPSEVLWAWLLEKLNDTLGIQGRPTRRQTV